MKLKNIVPGLLAGVLVFTTVFSPNMASAATPNEKGLIASYSFENTLANDKNQADAASMIVSKSGGSVTDYTGTAVYGEGRDGGKAVRLGDYGLKLNHANIGDNFTVSAWVKPDSTFVENQGVMFLGYGSPEKWLSVAGQDRKTSDECKIWANGNGYSWGTVGKVFIGSDVWHCLTITGDSSSVKVYLDGDEVANGKSNQPLTGENQDINIGASYWPADKIFSGLADDVKVYDRTLTPGEVYRLYDEDSTDAEIFEQTDISATTELSMLKGREETIELTMHPVVAESADRKISYESSDNAVASVDADGKVTAQKPGTAVITSTVTIGTVSKQAETRITVLDGLSASLKASYSFEDNIKNSVENGPDATAMSTGLKDYTGLISYDDNGVSGKAIRMNDDYGLKLNLENLGKEYTVSAWVKPDSTLAGNQCVVLLGYHNPEKWVAVSGNADGTSGCKLWANGSGFSWTTLALPTIDNSWHNLTLCGKDGKITAYLDGISFGAQNSNNPLDGENQDIYLGVNNWDKEFTGLMDEVEVYSTAMTEEEVQQKNLEDYNTKLQDELDKSVQTESILGSNKRADDVTYNLSLPTSVTINGAAVSTAWTCSKEGLIAKDGTLASPAKDTEVTLTVTAGSGSLKAAKELKLTIAGTDRIGLAELIKEAEAVDTAYCTEVSAQRLVDMIEEAKSVGNNYAAMETAYEKLNKAMEGLIYVDEYIDPFAFIAEAPVYQELKVEDSAQIFAVPEELEDMVSVEYSSADDTIATYEEGTVTGRAKGKVVVTATVTANYDGYQVEYSAAVNVTSDEPNKPDDPVDPVKEITKPVDEATLTEGSDVTLLVIPDKVKDMVTVEYSSDDEAVATYENGVVHGVKEGKVSVKAVIKGTDGTVLTEYSTDIIVVKKTEEPKPDDPDKPGNTDKPGNIEKPGNTTNPQVSNNKGTTAGTNKGVKTGDMANVTMWILVMTAAAVAVIVIRKRGVR